MSVKERIKEYLVYKNISMRKFTIKIGVSPSYVNNINKSIQPDKIDSITKCYPDLNISWLLTGEGNMIKSEEANFLPNENIVVSVSAEAWDVIKKQADSLASKDRQMEELIGLLKKANVPKEDNAKCAGASGSDLEK